MHCPFCNTPDSKVIDSRLAAQGAQIRRRRECGKCGERFTTFESYEVVMPRVIKSNGKNEPFDEQKLRRSLMHALQKRPVTQEQIETTLSDIQQTIRRLGERDMKSLTIGEIVMQALYQLDHVAYVRFASVYQDFQNVDAFREQIEKMQQRGEADKLNAHQLKESKHDY
ncbi:transcriptional repressor NrdR [Acinetobacter qingfengensis]|uniref:Transcriptional repressor NrdR n=1 Tax=Acinetobacter qingfengensis TaxID=1262585 RepID=A0A1E7RCT3_9GAMM|nr:transcriptional regulator NrdR [Acinetobacter qingfengensis]KAA8732140.1 transcriptional repressor NrdR [Acinetobacter qingfengensis]OEY97219.1 transcriptional regulator NrdR [Acinetobacter qingfengensis]